MRDTDRCAEQRQLGLRQLSVADAKLHDDDEERSGADERECNCRIGNERLIRTPSNARPHSNLAQHKPPRLWAH